MPRQKDLKRLVRARMKKTGEAYTAARAHIITKPKVESVADVVVAAPATVDYAALAGMSDAIIKEKTGCTWERWVYALDRHKANELSHRDIAALVKEKYKVGPWWTQTVTVGYERIKGLRVRGQQRNGTFEMTRSRTFNVPVDDAVRRVEERARSEAVAERRNGEGAHGHGAEVDAPRLDGRQHHRRRVRREGQVEELGGAVAYEAARS